MKMHRVIFSRSKATWIANSMKVPLYFTEEHTLPNRSMCPKETITKWKQKKVVPYIDKIKKKASIKSSAIKKMCATLKICCFRECGMIVSLLLIKDGREARMMYPHKKRTWLISLHTSSTTCMYVISYGILSDGRMIFKEAVNRNTATGLQEFPGLTICAWGIRNFYRNLCSRIKATMFSMACRYY